MKPSNTAKNTDWERTERSKPKRKDKHRGSRDTKRNYEDNE